MRAHVKGFEREAETLIDCILKVRSWKAKLGCPQKRARGGAPSEEWVVPTNSKDEETTTQVSTPAEAAPAVAPSFVGHAQRLVQRRN